MKRIRYAINMRFWLILTLGIAISTLGSLILQSVNEQRAHEALGSASESIADDVLTRIQLYQYGLRGVRGAIVTAGEQQVSRAMFHRYSQTRDIASEFPGARGFGFIRRVSPQDEARFLEQARADGRPDFAISQFSPHAGDRYVIQYLEPASLTVSAIGLDIASQQSRGDAAWLAALSGEVRLTAPITLVQAVGKKQQSFLMLLPIYRSSSTPATEDERKAALFGWSYAPLLTEEVLNGLHLDNEALNLRLTDITTQDDEELFYDSRQLSGARPILLSHALERDIFGRRWQIEVGAHPLFVERLHQTSPKLVLLLGILASVLLAALASIAGISTQRRKQVMLGQARLASIVEGSADGIIGKTLEGVVTSWNKGAQDLLGYSAEEAMGKRLLDLIVPPALASEEREILSRVRAGDRVINFDTQRRHKDGSLINVSVNVSPIYGEDGQIVGASKTLRDISAQKTAEARILELNANLEAQVVLRTSELTTVRDQLLMAADVAELGIWTWTLADNSLQWNDRMFEYYSQPLALRDGGLNYQHWYERVHVEDVERVSHQLSAAVAGQGVYDPIFRLQGQDGRIRFIQAGAQIERDSAGNPVRVTGINRDITAQRELESRLLEAKNQADAASTAKSFFLANMSHEIRTPMNAVLGMLQLLQSTALNTRQLDYVTKTQTAAKSLLGLLNDILDYSKIEAGKLRLDLHPFELEPLMRDLAVVLAGNQGSKQIEVMFDLDAELPSSLVGDSLRLQQVLINLAGNALKFTQEGQVVVSIKQLKRTRSTASLRIMVADSGIGIRPEQLQRIFEDFTQAEASTTRRFGGTGLGLVICKRLVALMGGQLRVESEPGEGSRFWFDITLEIAETAPLRLACPGVDSPIRLLIADDNEMAAELLMRTLGALGWTAERASGGTEAVTRVQAARARGEPYDVVLMDWRMPDMDGLSAARLIHSQRDDLPPPMVIMITAYGREVLADAHQEAGAPFVGFLTKPVTPWQLADAVYRAFHGTPAQPSIAAVPQFNRPQRLAGLRLLVVEDNRLNRQVADELLRGEGARVSLAEGGLEGVAMVHGDVEPFDAVLMDVQMPDIDGLEATRRIRVQSRFARLPIVAMTANASSRDRDACLEAGMNDHVSKPIDLELLVAVLLSQTGQAVEAGVVPSGQVSSDLVIESRASIMARYGGNLELICMVLLSFEAEMDKLLVLLASAIEAGDASETMSVLHGIKGSSGTMGAQQMSKLAARLEQTLREAQGAVADKVLLDRYWVVELESLLRTSLAQLREAFEPSGEEQQRGAAEQ